MYSFLKELKLKYFKVHNFLFSGAMKKNIIYSALIIGAWYIQTFHSVGLMATVIIIATFWKWISVLEMDFENFGPKDVVISEVILLTLWYGLFWHSLVIRDITMFIVYFAIFELQFQLP